jgi:hypothetical protein
MNTNQQIKRAYVRHYSDSGQVTAYIEWANGSRTEGEPENGYMLALMARAQREGLNITKESW